MLKKRLLLLASLAFAVAAPCQPPHATAARDLAEVKPETVGFSSQRLERLHAMLQKKVDDQQLPGIVTVLARHGKIVDFRTYGKRDLASGAPMDKDAIFRIYSMTKPITGVAMMILYEQGKWSPGDPIAKYIPEFAGLKVFKGMDSGGKAIVEDPVHAPNMAELMSHTAGFTYGIFGDTPVDKMYRDSAVLDSGNLQQMIDKLARIPLLYQPGDRWVYSVSVDIQGHLVEKLSGKTLGEFMRENIWQPLAMKDTGFHIAAEKAGRLAALYAANPSGGLAVTDGGNVATDYSKEPTMPSGGGGLLSTAHDYLRFGQMLLNGGELGWRADPRAVFGDAHADQPLVSGDPEQPGIRHRFFPHEPGLRVRLRLWCLHRPRIYQPYGWDRHLHVGWRRRHVVLDRSHERRRVRWDDPAGDSPRQP